MKMLQQYRELYDVINSEDLKLFDITPCAKWFISENEQEEYDICEDFHRTLPPFPLIWMEYEHPSSVYSKDRGRTNVRPHNVGFLAQTELLPDDFTEVAIGDLRNGACIQKAMLNRGRGKGGDLEYVPGANQSLVEAIDKGRRLKWFSVWATFTDDLTVQRITGKIAPLLSIRASFLDETGRAMPDFIIASPAFEEAMADRSAEERMKANNLAASSHTVFAFALQLMHCKNVTTSDVNVPDRVREKRIRRGVPDVRYKILNIEAMRSAIRYSSGDNGQSRHASLGLHFVRGHFKDFSQGKGLFGKYKGLYWWADRVAGDHSNGIIDKDYRVKSPA